MPNGLNREQLQRLARLGAHARLAELEAERQAILKAFPGLAAQAGKVGAAEPAAASGAGPSPARAPRRRKRSAAQRKAQSERMKKIWAERRKQPA
jgi:hypothetical protein